jgi:hypothetical protein
VARSPDLATAPTEVKQLAWTMCLAWIMCLAPKTGKQVAWIMRQQGSLDYVPGT